MIDKNRITEIGKFQKTHALRGELNALLNIDEAYVEDGNPLIIDMEGIPVPFYAESIRPKGATSFLIKLKGIDDVDEANQLVNKDIFALRGDLEPYIEDGDMLQDDIIGYEVEDENFGLIGKLEYIEDSTQNELLVVRTSGDEEIFIPLVSDFIKEIDEEHSRIITSLPEGLVNLNRHTQD